MVAYATDVGVNGMLKKSNKAYALVMSLMRHQGGVQPVSTCRCVLRIWHKEDLWFAETLVAALAGSLICHDGFNRTECGDPVKSNHTSSQLDGETYVKNRNSYLYDNMKAGLEDVRTRRALLRHLDKMESMRSKDDLQDSVDEMGMTCALLQRQLEELQDERDKAHGVEGDNRPWETEEELVDLFTKLH